MALSHNSPRLTGLNCRSALTKVEPHADEFEGTIYYSEIDNLWRAKASAEEVAKSIAQKGNELLTMPVE